MSESIRIVALFGARAYFGQERANVETLAALREQGCAVLCVVRDEDWDELMAIRETLSRRGLDWVKAPYIDYPIRGWIMHVLRRNPGAFVRANKALKRIVAEFGATHIHAFNSFYVASFWWALRNIDLPMVYRIGDLPVLHNVLFRAVWSFVSKRTTHFVADSEFIAREVVATGVEPRRISVIYAPAPSRVGAQPAGLPAATLVEGALRFAYVGQILERKGVGVLVDAFRRLAAQRDNAHLLIAGPITEWRGDDWARDLRARVEGDSRIAARIHFLGLVENAPDMLVQCHVHVAPSLLEEGYGLVVVEAKQAARPSIIFRSGGMSELVTNDVDGVVLADGNAETLAGAMERYACSPALARTHGEAALASIAKLGIPLFAQRWRHVYEATLNLAPA